MDTFFLYSLLSIAGLVVLGGALGIIDKIFFGGLLGDWIQKRYDYKQLLPIESSADVDTPFLLFMAFPIIIIFRVISFPVFLIFRISNWFKNQPEDEQDIGIQDKMFRKKD